ncbi:type II 3-dehydroquinate dehydratase [Roseibium sediminis]|uniref:type II 3-dehydroquinate dehydratase n=1 Tax=Roseibium sediminis TaxID=1775174 RepID=UPI00123E0AA2|nr:type II 3-dehydroquinate dehydratase [Roseibium sediminis]
MSQTVFVINGPNLNLLGLRQPEIYGSETLADVEERCVKLSKDLGLAPKFFQSNAEHEIIDLIHKARHEAAAIVINPAAYSHTSVAIFDALNTFDGIVLEVHISNIHAREAFRHHSFVSARAEGVIAGFGTQGYELALLRLARLLNRSGA